MIWDFLQRYDDSWIWRREDRHHVTESSRNFAALEECIDDAARHDAWLLRSRGCRDSQEAGKNNREQQGKGGDFKGKIKNVIDQPFSSWRLHVPAP